jgi:hypothetical protein
VRTGKGETETQQVEGWVVEQERRRAAATTEFLRDEIGKSRERLSQLENQPDTHSEDLLKARSHMSELEQKYAASQIVGQVDEQRARELRREPSVELNRSLEQLERLRVRAAEGQSRRERIGSKVAAIEIRGLSDAAGNDLLGRLPVHEGDTLTEQSIEGVGRAIRQFDEHLEFNYGWEPEGVVLRIHPAGAAGAPMLRRK